MVCPRNTDAVRPVLCRLCRQVISMWSTGRSSRARLIGKGLVFTNSSTGVDLPVRSSTFLLTSNVTIISCESTLSYPHLRSGSYRVPLTVCLSHLKQPMMPSTTIPSLGSTRSRWNKWPAHSSLRPTSPVSQNPDDAISASTRHTKQV